MSICGSYSLAKRSLTSLHYLLNTSNAFITSIKRWTSCWSGFSRHSGRLLILRRSLVHSVLFVTRGIRVCHEDVSKAQFISEPCFESIRGAYWKRRFCIYVWLDWPPRKDRFLLTIEPTVKCIKDFIFIRNLYHAAAQFTWDIFSIQRLIFFFVLCNFLYHHSQFIPRESSGRKMVLNDCWEDQGHFYFTISSKPDLKYCWKADILQKKPYRNCKPIFILITDNRFKSKWCILKQDARGPPFWIERPVEF